MRDFELRPVDADDDGDLDAAFEIFSDLETIRWLDNPPFHPWTERSQAVAWARRVNEREAVDPTVRERAIVADGRTAGFVSIARLTHLERGFEGQYEIGWKVRASARGRGVATRAARRLARAAFDGGLRELMIDMYPDNAASAVVARRLGAEELGVVPDPWYGSESLLFRLTPGALRDD